MRLVMRKPEFCLSENKGANQLRSDCEADHRLCFRYTDLSLVGNPEDRFSHVAAQINVKYEGCSNVCVQMLLLAIEPSQYHIYDEH